MPCVSHYKQVTLGSAAHNIRPPEKLCIGFVRICAMAAGRVAKCPFGLLLTRHCPLPLGLSRRTHASAGQSAPDASHTSLPAPSLPHSQLRQKRTRLSDMDTTHDEAPPAKRRTVLAQPTAVQRLGHPATSLPKSGRPLVAAQAHVARQGHAAATAQTSSPNTRAMACGLDQVLFR